MKRYMPREHPGWIGAFTRDEYPGALRNGTPVVKVTFERGDAHPIGTRGVVLGSVGHPEIGIGYFVEWETLPRHAVLVVSGKIRAAADVSSRSGRA
jgi:hypothetical protein